MNQGDLMLFTFVVVSACLVLVILFEAVRGR